MHVRSIARRVLAAVRSRDVPYVLTVDGLVLRARWLKRSVVVGGRRSDMTGLGKNGIAIAIRAVQAGARLDARTRVPHGWADEEVVNRVASVVVRAKALLKLEKRKMKRRKRSGNNR